MPLSTRENPEFLHLEESEKGLVQSGIDRAVRSLAGGLRAHLMGKERTMKQGFSVLIENGRREAKTVSRKVIAPLLTVALPQNIPTGSTFGDFETFDSITKPGTNRHRHLYTARNKDGKTELGLIDPEPLQDRVFLTTLRYDSGSPAFAHATFDARCLPKTRWRHSVLHDDGITRHLWEEEGIPQGLEYQQALIARFVCNPEQRITIVETRNPIVSVESFMRAPEGVRAVRGVNLIVQHAIFRGKPACTSTIAKPNLPDIYKNIVSWTN